MVQAFVAVVLGMSGFMAMAATSEQAVVGSLFNGGLQGQLVDTSGNEVSISGNGFFALSSASGMLYTRNLVLRTNEQSVLVNGTSGHEVLILGKSGEPVALSFQGRSEKKFHGQSHRMATMTAMQVEPDGTISALYSDGSVENVGMLAIALFQNARKLELVDLQKDLLKGTTQSGEPHFARGFAASRGKIMFRQKELTGKAFYQNLLDESEAVDSSSAYYIEVQSLKNGLSRGTSRVITTMNNRAEVRQTTGKYEKTNAVILQKSSPGFLDVDLEIREKLPKVSFTVKEKFEIREVDGEKEFSLQMGDDIYSYKLKLRPDIKETL